MVRIIDAFLRLNLVRLDSLFTRGFHKTCRICDVPNAKGAIAKLCQRPHFLFVNLRTEAWTQLRAKVSPVLRHSAQQYLRCAPCNLLHVMRCSCLGVQHNQ